MTTRVKLSELVDARAVMSRSVWHLDVAASMIVAPNADPTSFLNRRICQMSGINPTANGHSIVAMHNAAEALIEIEIAISACELHQHKNISPTDFWPDEYEWEAKLLKLQERYHEALNKVEL